MSATRCQLIALVDPEQHAALKALSERTRVPMSVYVRAALAAFLDEHATETDTPEQEDTDAA